jgi:threonine dehydratase
MYNEPNFQDIKRASKRIDSFIHKTPILTNQSVNSIVDGNVFFKCENFQKTGSFKMRGSSNAVLSLSENELKNGVVTVSSGNHGAALAHSASLNGVKSYVVTPNSTNPIKIQAMRYYGAEIIFCESTIDSRESTFQKIQNETGAIPIHPFNDYKVITGAGTVALEFINEVKTLDIIVVPIGGGGLISGIGVVVSHLLPTATLVGVEPECADYGRRSLHAKNIVPSEYPNTLADGLRSTLGEKPFLMIQKFVSEILTVSEDEIMESMRFMWERMKIIIEPSSAVTLAAMIKSKEKFHNKKIGVIISGGNVDLSKLNL